MGILACRSTWLEDVKILKAGTVDVVGTILAATVVTGGILSGSAPTVNPVTASPARGAKALTSHRPAEGAASPGTTAAEPTRLAHRPRPFAVAPIGSAPVVSALVGFPRVPSAETAVA